MSVGMVNGDSSGMGGGGAGAGARVVGGGGAGARGEGVGAAEVWTVGRVAEEGEYLTDAAEDTEAREEGRTRDMAMAAVSWTRRGREQHMEVGHKF
jgi:hypothetical protein